MRAALPTRMTNLGGQPIAPTPLQAPTLPGSPTPPPFTFTAPTVGPAPTSIGTAAFTAPGGPNPYQFRVDQANRGAERSAAARGTLLSGGFQAALARLNQGLASEETQNVYNRARDTYALNRDTNQQNFGQNLASYNAGTGAALDAGRLGLAGETAGYDRTYGAQRDAHRDAVQLANQQTNVLNANTQAADIARQQMADFNAQLEAQKEADVAAQNAATTRMNGTPPLSPAGSMPTSLGGFGMRVPRRPLPRGAGY
jgi:hypothetical protein